MIRLACLFLLSLALPALAETASIRSGEHDGFTRLVVELPSASGWTLGRTPMGYGFLAGRPGRHPLDFAAAVAGVREKAICEHKS